MFDRVSADGGNMPKAQSGNDRRTRALRKIFEPLHEMRSSRAPRPRARSLCVVSSSPHVRQSGERSNQRQSRSARVDAVGGLPRARALPSRSISSGARTTRRPLWTLSGSQSCSSPLLLVITRLGLRVTQQCCFSVTRGAGRGAAPQHAHEISWKQHSSISRYVSTLLNFEMTVG